MILLSKQQLIAIHDQIVLATGGTTGIRDEGLLDAAIAVPWQTFGGNELLPSLEEKAARLGYGLVIILYARCREKLNLPRDGS